MKRVKSWWANLGKVGQRTFYVVISATLTVVLIVVAAERMSPQQRAVDHYLDAVEHNDYFTAYKNLCSTMKQQAITPDILERVSQGTNERLSFGEITSHEFVSSGPNSTDSTVTIKASYGGDLTRELTLSVARENGKYLFCGIGNRSNSSIS